VVRFLPWLLLALPGTGRTDSSDLVHGALDPPDLIRGVTVSCQRVGRGWGTDGLAAELNGLVELGVNWVAILIKAYLAYWGSPFSWHGEIEFAEPEQRSRFFEQHASWITDLPRYGSVHPHV